MKHSSSPRSRIAGLLTVLATALSLPSIASANHTTCSQAGENFPLTAGDPADCPEFSPDVLAKVQFPYRDIPSAINIEYAQADHESQTLQLDYYFPKDWQFAVGSMRAARNPANTGPATSCADLFDLDDVIDTEDNGTVPDTFVPGRVLNAEVISGAPGAKMRLNNVAGQNTNQPAKLNWGKTGGPVRANNGALVFWDWNPITNTARLCLSMTLSGQHTTNGDESYLNLRPRQILMQLNLERINDPTYGWKLNIPLEQIWTNTGTPALGSYECSSAAHPCPGVTTGTAWANEASKLASLLLLDIEMSNYSAGNWNLSNGIGCGNRRTVPNQCSVVWSRAPRTPVNTSLKVVATACRNGANTVAACTSDMLFKVTRTLPLSITQPPAYQPVPFGRFNGGGEIQMDVGAASTGNRYNGYSFTDGTPIVPLKWTEPAAAAIPSGVSVAGYALVIARLNTPNDPSTAVEEAEGNILYRRLIKGTNLTCAPACQTDVDVSSFPSNTPAFYDGKYNAALVTIYQTPWGLVRSDGLCDGGGTDDGRGVVCPANQPKWLTAGSPDERGASLWQFVVREHIYPQRYRTGATGDYQMLLVDMLGRKGELYFWRNAAPAAVNPAASQTASPCGSLLPTPNQSAAQNVITCVVNGITGGLNPGPITRSASNESPGTSYSGEGIALRPLGTNGGTPDIGVFSWGDLRLEGESYRFRVTGGYGLPNCNACARLHLYKPGNGDLDWFKLPPLPTTGDPLATANAILGGWPYGGGRYGPDLIEHNYSGSTF